MADKKLKVIPKPAEGTRVVLKRAKGEGVIISGKGELNLVCGKCDAVLAKGVKEGQVKNLVLHCNNCGSYNDTE